MTKEDLRYTKRPKECTKRELGEFGRLVRMGGEVNDGGLDDRIRASHLLAFACICGEIVAVAALKNPLPGYRTRISRGAGVDLDSDQWLFELGYIFVHPDSRGKSLSTVLSGQLLSAVKDVGVFATTRTNNDAMKILLPRLGFMLTGAEYTSSRGADRLRLYLRDVSGGR